MKIESIVIISKEESKKMIFEHLKKLGYKPLDISFLENGSIEVDIQNEIKLEDNSTVFSVPDKITTTRSTNRSSLNLTKIIPPPSLKGKGLKIKGDIEIILKSNREKLPISLKDLFEEFKKFQALENRKYSLSLEEFSKKVIAITYHKNDIVRIDKDKISLSLKSQMTSLKEIKKKV